MSAVDVLTNLGFTEGGAKYFQSLSDDLELSKEGEPHKVLYSGTMGAITAVIEKNISPDTAGGVEVIQKHPAVLILESPKGRVAIPNHDNPDNAELIQNVISDLS